MGTSYYFTRSTPGGGLLWNFMCDGKYLLPYHPSESYSHEYLMDVFPHGTFLGLCSLARNGNAVYSSNNGYNTSFWAAGLRLDMDARNTVNISFVSLPKPNPGPAFSTPAFSMMIAKTTAVTVL